MINNEHEFISIDDKIFESGLSFEALGLLIYMLSKPKDWKFSMQELQKQGNIGRDRLRRILRELAEKGYLERKRIRTPGGRFVWEWNIKSHGA